MNTSVDRLFDAENVFTSSSYGDLPTIIEKVGDTKGKIIIKVPLEIDLKMFSTLQILVHINNGRSDHIPPPS